MPTVGYEFAAQGDSTLFLAFVLAHWLDIFDSRRLAASVGRVA